MARKVNCDDTMEILSDLVKATLAGEDLEMYPEAMIAFRQCPEVLYEYCELLGMFAPELADAARAKFEPKPRKAITPTKDLNKSKRKKA